MGLDADTGATRWTERREHGGDLDFALRLPGKTPAEDAVLLQSRSRLTALEPRSGRQLWSYAGDCHTMVTAAVCEGCVYLAADGLCACEASGRRRREAACGTRNVSTRAPVARSCTQEGSI